MKFNERTNNASFAKRERGLVGDVDNCRQDELLGGTLAVYNGG